MGCGSSAANNANISHANSGVNRSQSAPVTATRPLTKPKNYRHGSPITQGELNNNRNDFWTSRTDGVVVMWQTIRTAAEALLNDDVVLANAILEAGSIFTPNGTLEVCYDERGQQYKVPLYCFSNPAELTNEPVHASTPDSGYRSDKHPTSNQGSPVKVRIRINPGDINVILEAKSGNTAYDLKSLLVEHVRENRIGVTLDADRQRVIFMGKEMNNKTKLSEAGVDDTKVVQVFLRPTKS